MRPATPTARRRLRRLGLALAAVALATTAACSSDNGSAANSTSTATSSPASSGAPIDYAALAGTLNGSGSTFQDPFLQKAITEFKAKAPKVAVSYTKSGSGAGKTDLQNKVVQFAGTDSLIKAEDKAKFQGGDVLYFPTVAAPITVSYNLSGIDRLQLSGETLGAIFAGTITTWNDPMVAADNPGITLPATRIVVVHRSDASGTTSNFTKYLGKAGGSAWTLGSGDTVNWPATTLGAEKNSGVASVIGTTEGAIGYVDLADAVNANLHVASIKNEAGKFVAPTLDGASAALAGVDIKADLTYDPIDAKGDAAYPITSPTWIIVYKVQPDAATAAALKGFLHFLLTDGQTFASSVGYAKLPADLAAKAIAQLDLITPG